MYERLISRAKAMGISLEIFSVKMREYTIAKDKFYVPIIVEETGYGIRLIDEKYRIGYIYTKKLNDNVLEEALKIAKLGESDKANILPSKQPVKRINENQINEDVVQDTIKDLIELEEKVNLTSASASAINYEVSIFNTEGVEVSEKRGVLSVQASANDGNNSPEIYEYLIKRDSKISLEKLKASIIEKVKIMKKKERIDPKGYDVTFTQKALDSLFSSLFPSLFSARNFYKETSPFKLGELVNENLEIIDDPLNQSLPFSRSFDDEGNPSRVSKVIESGLVKRPLTNTYWATRMSVENTSSASRNLDWVVPSYFIPPHVDFSNIIFDYKNTESNIEENSVIVDQLEGIDTADLSSGNFSLVANVSWLNRKDEKIGLEELLITGNLKQLLKNIVSTSKNIENYGKVVSGKLKVRGLSLLM
ncbi:TldD/PmbA family protein [Saccharolobus solfataricus]|uniref:TldD/PmbA family protein n=3 Tax=Saccharolobus solfataricus TaxID=2287 RepID=Q9UX51_SACSO|nr:TldD/PmbA family protein [Saccharolobus solfataricus]AAK40966.1 Zn-dependent protease, tldE protein homolog, putative (tldE) [Saccharolobus solfataricus P2]AKA73994.1 TldD/PmbA family protein [Saccharolobus solfataricus]AKA76691.1 TldD/PmbA family protein [Saccharolobus solfataricus]AKA79385.1 TldD/PmbA family protein [Saccharolobus solfataricus]AZF68472.1 TldD/PmbA family protein [Saccharolobus solfataricus]